MALKVCPGRLYTVAKPLRQGEKYLSLTTEEMHEQVRNLITVGKERGYLLSEEVEQVLPAELTSTEEIDDLLSTFERIGIVLYEDLAAAKAARATVDPIVSESPELEWKNKTRVGERRSWALPPGC